MASNEEYEQRQFWGRNTEDDLEYHYSLLKVPITVMITEIEKYVRPDCIEYIFVQKPYTL